MCTCDVLVAPRRRDRAVQRCERARGAARGGRTRSCRWWRTRRVCGECGGGWGGGWRGGLSRVSGGAFDAYGAVRHAVRLARCRLHRHSSLCGHHVQSAFWGGNKTELDLGRAIKSCRKKRVPKKKSSRGTVPVAPPLAKPSPQPQTPGGGLGHLAHGGFGDACDTRRRA